MAASGGAEPSQILIAIALRKCNLVSLLLEPKFPSVLNTPFAVLGSGISAATARFC